MMCGFSWDIVFPASPPRDEQSDEKDCIRRMIRFSSIPNLLQKERIDFFRYIHYTVSIFRYSTADWCIDYSYYSPIESVSAWSA
jgi:hypothetical protein